MELYELFNNLNFSSILWQILTPLLFSLADIITGFIQAVINNDINSSKMRVGLLHKILIILVIILSFLIDVTFSIPFISKVVCFYVIVMELISILENISKAGIDLGKLKDLIKIKREEE